MVMGGSKPLMRGASVAGRGLGVAGRGLESKFPGLGKRAIGAGAVAGAGVVSMGVGGVGPLSALGDEYERTSISQYGDTEATRRLIDAQQGVFTGAGVAALGVAGLGLFGRGPMSIDYMDKAKTGLQNLGRGLQVAATEPYNMAVNYRPGQYGGSFQSVGNVARGAVDAVRHPMSDDRYWLRKPFRSGIAVGAAAGIGASAYNRNEPFGSGREGTIVAINSSQGGGISQDLQRSTEGLVFNLHRNNKSMRSRYQ